VVTLVERQFDPARYTTCGLASPRTWRRRKDSTPILLPRWERWVSGLSWTLAIQRQFEEPTHVTVISREFRNRERCEALTRNEQPIKINAALSYPILSYVQKYTRKMIAQALHENIECYCTQSPSYQAVRPLRDRGRGHQCINPPLIRSLNTRSTSISCRSPASEH
jgi:hypothetical protein